jgi:hypothetical protein
LNRASASDCASLAVAIASVIELRKLSDSFFVGFMDLDLE